MPKEPKITRRKITDYIPDMSNANKGTERGSQMLEASLNELGAGRSLVADKDGRLVAGNKTLEAAVNAGIVDVIEIETDGNALIVHKRPDWDLTEPQGPARQYAYRDNRISEVSMTWDDEQLLADLNAGVDLSHLFTESELDALLAGLRSDPKADPGAQIDRAAELQEKWEVKRGDLWIIGKHRLLCGDSTNADDVAKVMGSDCFRMIWTDPPYGVNYASLEDSRVLHGHANKRASSHIEGDTLKPEQVYELVKGSLSTSVPHAIPGAGLYVATPAGSLYLRFAQAIADAGFSYRQQLVWVKNAPGFGRTDYHYKHEPIIYGWLEGGSHYFVDDHTKTTVIEAQKPLHSLEHPTMKPVELITQMIENSSQVGEIVYEPFCGSGSTLAACELTGRVGRGIEIAENYCAVILERMSGMGLEPRLSE